MAALASGGGWSIDDFEFGKELGAGKFGTVYRAREKKSAKGYIVAIKVISKAELKGVGEHQFRREVEIQTRLRHPNLLPCFGCVHDDKNIYMILEYAPGGELYDALLKEGPFSEERSAKYMQDICHGLQFLRENSVLHRDIKCENILIGFHGELRLADFGASVKSNSARDTFCGTPYYHAPEMVEHKTYGHEIDAWALGVLLFEFLTGSPPFECENRVELYSAITNVDIEYPRTMERDARNLVSKLLVYEPSKRISVEAILIHPWMKRCLDTDAEGASD